MANVRIIEQPEITTLSGNEYLVTDSPTAGTKKITPKNLVEAAGGGTGVSNDLKEALLQLASKVAYIDDDGQEYYQDLYDALYDTTWKVTNTLTHCSSSNSAESVTKNGSYSATITASVGYTLTGATVSITMGGTDITASAYNNGTISIASVTGALVISISAAAKTVSSISAVYTQSGTVYDTDSLDSLKSDLVVTATYSDTTTATVPSADYTLSGTLEAGTSTITVSYGGKTTTFSVTVTSADPSYVSDGLVMWLDGIKNGTNGAHESTLTTWVDQTGNGWDWTNGGSAVTQNSVVFNGESNNYLYRNYQSIPQNVAMVEIVAKKTRGGCIVTGFGRNYVGNMNIPSTGNNLVFHTSAGSGADKNTAFDFGTAGEIHSANSSGYLDGVAITQFASSAADWQYEYPSIGKYRASDGTGDEYKFIGEIYCIRMYSRILTEQEILANYAADVIRFGLGGA